MNRSALYFAYGSNLSASELDRKGVHPEAVGRAWLPDHRLSLGRSSRRGGALDVVAAKGSVVPGYLYRLSEPDRTTLDLEEGVPGGAYVARAVHVFTETGEILAAWTYTVAAPAGPVDAQDGYRQIVEEGRRERGLSTADLDRVFAHDPAAGLETALFVYGTLMRGGSRADRIARHRPSCWVLAELGGAALVDCGAYPGLRLGGPRSVRGELVRVPDGALPALLEDLDAIEGFAGYGPDSLYHRHLVQVDAGDGRIRSAWTYVWVDPDDAPPVPGGDWRAHRGDARAFFEALAAAHCDGRPEAEVARAVARGHAFPPAHDGADWVPLAAALARGEVSERRLAQTSGRWTALVP